MTVAIGMANYDSEHFYAASLCRGWADSNGSLTRDPMKLLQLLTRHYASKERIRALIRLGNLAMVDEVPMVVTNGEVCNRALMHSCVAIVDSTIDASPMALITDGGCGDGLHLMESYSTFTSSAWDQGVDAILLYDSSRRWELLVNTSTSNPFRDLPYIVDTRNRECFVSDVGCFVSDVINYRSHRRGDGATP
jgi:hypothetical protein